MLQINIGFADAGIRFSRLAGPELNGGPDFRRIVGTEGKTRFERNKVVGVDHRIDLIEFLALPDAAVQRLGRHAEAARVLADGLVRLTGFRQIGDFRERGLFQHGLQVRGQRAAEIGPERVVLRADFDGVEETAQTGLRPSLPDGIVNTQYGEGHHRS